jgi:hypothetical protein
MPATYISRATPFYALTGKRVKRNLNGLIVDHQIVGPEGDWTISQGAELARWYGWIFLYNGEKVSDLNMLPICE